MTVAELKRMLDNFDDNLQIYCEDYEYGYFQPSTAEITKDDWGEVKGDFVLIS